MYLNKFIDAMKIAGVSLTKNYILVEKLPEPEVQHKSGIILKVDDRVSSPTNIELKPEFYRVLAVGTGYSDGDLDVEVGNIVLLSPVSVRTFKHFGKFVDYRPDSIGLSTDAEVQMVFETKETLEAFFNTLNQ